MRTSAFLWKFCCWQKYLLNVLRFNDDSFLIGIFARNIFYLSKQVAFLPLRTNSQHHYNWIAPRNCQIYEIHDALSLHLDWSDGSFHQFRSITDTLRPFCKGEKVKEKEMILQQALLVLQLVLFQNVQRSPGIEFVSPLHQVEPFYLCLVEEENTFANNF